MTGHSILYLGRGEFAADYLGELETLPSCTLLTRSSVLALPVDAPYTVDLVLLEVGPLIAQSGNSLAELIHSLQPYPVIALSKKEHEHRGIAAMRAGAQGYICIDDITVDGQDAIFDHAVKRTRIKRRLSDTDVSVLAMLRNINDGVIIVPWRARFIWWLHRVNPALVELIGAQGVKMFRRFRSSQSERRGVIGRALRTLSEKAN